MACQILVPQLGTEPTSRAVEARSPSHWTGRESLRRVRSPRANSAGNEVSQGPQQPRPRPCAAHSRQETTSGPETGAAVPNLSPAPHPQGRAAKSRSRAGSLEPPSNEPSALCRWALMGASVPQARDTVPCGVPHSDPPRAQHHHPRTPGPGPQSSEDDTKATPSLPPPVRRGWRSGDSALDSVLVTEALQILPSLDGSAPRPGPLLLGGASRRHHPGLWALSPGGTLHPTPAQTRHPGLPFSRPPEEPRAAAGGAGGPTLDGWPGSFMRLTTFSDSCGKD